jgi:hypothetical protein
MENLYVHVVENIAGLTTGCLALAGDLVEIVSSLDVDLENVNSRELDEVIDVVLPKLATKLAQNKKLHGVLGLYFVQLLAMQQFMEDETGLPLAYYTNRASIDVRTAITDPAQLIAFGNMIKNHKGELVNYVQTATDTIEGAGGFPAMAAAVTKIISKFIEILRSPVDIQKEAAFCAEIDEELAEVQQRAKSNGFAFSIGL